MSPTRRSPGVHTEGEEQSVNPWKVVILLSAALTLCRFFFLAQIDLHPDEAYYWLWSRVPSTGYYDHAPMIAWWIWLSTRLVGDEPFGVRLFPILSVLIVSAVTVATSWELYRDRALAVRAGLFLNATLLIGIAALFATPDAPSVLFWTLTVWSLALLRRSGDTRLWLLVGLSAGLGCLSKYTNLFIGPGIVFWLVLDADARRRLVGPAMFAGAAIALAVFSPVIFWNFQHHWVSFAKQFGRIDRGHPTLFYVFEFIVGQFGLANPAIAIFAYFGLALAWRQRRFEGVSASLFLAALSAPLVAYMLFHSFHSRVQGNWLMPVYPAMAIVAAEAAGHFPPSGHFGRLARWGACFGIGLIIVLFGFVASPLGQRAGFPSPADRLLGWKAFAQHVEDIRMLSGAAWIGTLDYGVTGELAFYGKDPQRVKEIIDRQRYSFETSDPQLARQPGLLVIPLAKQNMAWLKRCLPQMTLAGEADRSAGARILERYAIVKIGEAPSDIFSEGCDPGAGQ